MIGVITAAALSLRETQQSPSAHLRMVPFPPVLTALAILASFSRSMLTAFCGTKENVCLEATHKAYDLSYRQLKRDSLLGSESMKPAAALQRQLRGHLGPFKVTCGHREFRMLHEHCTSVKWNLSSA